MPTYKETAAACTHGEPPACANACPFELDIRSLVSRIQRKSFDAVYRQLRDALLFPETAVKLCSEPCQEVCERRGTDESIRLLRLEQAALAYAKKKEPLRLNVPQKNERIAVIGAGISGLACALRLASRRYQVTVYEKSGKIGGSLWDRFPDGSFLEEITLQFKYADCTFQTATSVDDLDELSADAVYVATGLGGNDFGGPKNGVFLGGSSTGVSLIYALKQGIDASNDIESFLKTGRMPLAAAKPLRPVNGPDPQLLKSLAAIEPSGELYTQDEAVAEASRCLKCDCDICVRRCPLINHFKRFPAFIAEEVEGTVHPTDIFKNRLATRMVASCDNCGICREACPRGVDVRSIISDARQEMVSKGDMPKAYSAFWLSDMEHAERFSVLKPSKDADSCRYVFFPGCQLGASDPRYVTETYRRLLETYPDTALLADCCGAPAFWAGDEALHEEKTQKLTKRLKELGSPTPVCACPTCAEMLRRFLPDCRPVSLYSLELGGAAQEGGTVSVFDPCSSRFDTAAQDGVRSILTRAGFELEALMYERENTLCCGWGGQYIIANPKMSKSVVESRICLSERPYVTYCTNCRDTFAKEGKPVLHILDVLLGLNTASRKPPTITERRENREKLSHELSGSPAPDTDGEPALRIDPELAEKLSRDWILESDLREVILHCEQNNQKIYDAENDCFIGHLKLGYMTCWVVYKPEAPGFRVLNAYSHRMDILET